jgi:hypothetical protein
MLVATEWKNKKEPHRAEPSQQKVAIIMRERGFNEVVGVGGSESAYA